MYMFMMQNKIYNRNTIFVTNFTEGCFRLKKLLSERLYDVHTAVMMHIPSQTQKAHNMGKLIAWGTS